MFDSELKNHLTTDSELVAYMSKFSGYPSIFSESAPEGVDFPYIVFRIMLSKTDAIVVNSGSVFIDYYAYDTSRTVARKAAFRIEALLDQYIMQNSRYDSIRFFYFAGSFTPEEDPRAIHYNTQFTIRSGRKAWSQQFA